MFFLAINELGCPSFKVDINNVSVSTSSTVSVKVSMFSFLADSMGSKGYDFKFGGARHAL